MLVGIGSFAFSGRAASPTRPPNLVVILVDDLGYSDLGCYGSEIKTPNLDHLAREGIRFNQFYNTGRCWPTRAALMTGYYPQQVRMDPPTTKVPDWARSLPSLLKPLGYLALIVRANAHIFGHAEAGQRRRL